MTRDLKDLLLVYRIATGSVYIFPESSTGGKVGKGVTCWPNFNFKTTHGTQGGALILGAVPACKTQAQLSLAP